MCIYIYIYISLCMYIYIYIYIYTYISLQDPWHRGKRITGISAVSSPHLGRTARLDDRITCRKKATRSICELRIRRLRIYSSQSL